MSGYDLVRHLCIAYYCNDYIDGYLHQQVCIEVIRWREWRFGFQYEIGSEGASYRVGHPGGGHSHEFDLAGIIQTVRSCIDLGLSTIDTSIVHHSWFRCFLVSGRLGRHVMDLCCHQLLVRLPREEAYTIQCSNLVHRCPSLRSIPCHNLRGLRWFTVPDYLDGHLDCDDGWIHVCVGCGKELLSHTGKQQQQ